MLSLCAFMAPSRITWSTWQRHNSHGGDVIKTVLVVVASPSTLCYERVLNGYSGESSAQDEAFVVVQASRPHRITVFVEPWQAHVGCSQTLCDSHNPLG